MPETLASIKRKMESNVGESLIVTSQASRKKVTKRHGVLRETFPAIFIVDLSESDSAVDRVSYSYTDILTKNIEIMFEKD